MKENYQIYLPYQFHLRAHSLDREPKLSHKKMKTMFLSNMSKSRRLTSTFFPIISVFIEKFKIFLIMKRIEKIVRYGKFFRSCQMKVCTTTMSNFIKIREVLLWFLDIYFWALIPDMRSQQKRGSDVQVALTFKWFEPEFPDTTQIKDLSKSFLNIINFN